MFWTCSLLRGFLYRDLFSFRVYRGWKTAVHRRCSEPDGRPHIPTKGSGFLPREQRINLPPIIAFTTARPDSWQHEIGLSQSSTRSSSAHRRGSRRFHEVRTKACVNKEALASRGLEVQNRRETFCKRLRFKTPIGWPGICLSSLASAPRPAFGAFVPMWSPEGNESV